MRVRLLALISLLLLSLPCLAGARLAILGDLAGERKEMDLLTALLSNEQDVELVERSEIERVIVELKLAAAGASTEDYVKTGALLGAKGVIVVKSFEFEKRKVLSARLLSTDSGAIFGAWIQDAPSTEASHFAEAAKHKFMPLLPKLSLDRKDIVAVSILDIRSIVSGHEGESLERKLTMLLSQRLMTEKDIVVLERWRLGNISWEKALNLDANPFWTGSCVLDGSLEAPMDGKGVLKVSLRLRRPGEPKPEIVEVSGSSKDLLGFVESMIPPLMAKLGAKDAPQSSWDVAKEADLFFDEAKWLLGANSYERALESADAAAALGKTGIDMDKLRLSASFFIVNQRLSKFASLREPGPYDSFHAQNMSLLFPPFHQFGGRNCYDSSIYYKADFAQLRVDSSALFRDVANFYELTFKICDALGSERKSPGPMGFVSEDRNSALKRALFNACTALNMLYLGKCGYVDVRLLEEANAVRALSRKAFAMLPEGSWKDDHISIDLDFLLALNKYLPETPEESLAFIKALLAGERKPFSRGVALSAMQNLAGRGVVPYVEKGERFDWLADWDGLQRVSDEAKANPNGPFRSERADKLWNAYIDGLRNSGSERDLVDACVLQSRTFKGVGAQRMKDIVWSHRASILDGGDAKSLCSAAFLNFPELAKDKDFKLKLLLYALSDEAPLNSSYVTRYIGDRELLSLPGAKESVASLWGPWRERLLKDPALAKNISFVEEQLSKSAPDLLPAKTGDSAPSKLEKAVARPLLSFDFAKGFDKIHSADNLGFSSAGWMNGSFAVTGFGQFNDLSDRSPGVHLKHYVFIVSVEGTKLSSELIQAKTDEKDYSYEFYPYSVWRDGQTLVGVSTSGWIYVKKAGDASPFSLKAKTGLGSPKQLCVAGGKAYAGYGDGLAEFDLASGETKIVASNRRNPAASPLDSFPFNDLKAVFFNGPGRIILGSYGKICSYDVSSGAVEDLGKEFRSSVEFISSPCGVLAMPPMHLNGTAKLFNERAGEVSVLRWKARKKPSFDPKELAEPDYKMEPDLRCHDGKKLLTARQLGPNLVALTLDGVGDKSFAMKMVEVDFEALRKDRLHLSFARADGAALYLAFGSGMRPERWFKPPGILLKLDLPGIFER